VGDRDVDIAVEAGDDDSCVRLPAALTVAMVASPVSLTNPWTRAASHGESAKRAGLRVEGAFTSRVAAARAALTFV
jgi:hypothetical protein